MANKRQAETFEVKDGARGWQALIMGIEGPPGGGKTFSALRMATGMANVRGGPVCVIDTDNDRALQYADYFKFKHLPLRPPFRPLRFLDAVRFLDEKFKPGCIVVDSMSDEHEGEGGTLDYHAEEKERFGGGDNMNQRAWIKPKADRLAMINGFMQMQSKVPLILCFRARQKTKPDAKGKPQNIGWQPIAPAEIVGNCTVLCLLPPNSDGTPKWKTGVGEEDFVLKLPIFARPIFETTGQLREAHGEALAKWARGDKPKSKAKKEQAPQGAPGEVAGDTATDGAEGGDTTPATTGADDFPGDRKPAAFKFTLVDLKGKEHESPDGALWADKLIQWLEKRTDKGARETWLAHRKFIIAAAKAGHTELTDKIQAAWDERGLSLGDDD